MDCPDRARAHTRSESCDGSEIFLGRGGGTAFGAVARMASTHTARFFTALGVCLLAFASTASAQELPGFASNGPFVGASNVPNFTFDGHTFDGSTYYRQIGGDEILILPELAPTAPFRALGGLRPPR